MTLAQSVLSALPTYKMQVTLLPKGICNRIEQLIRNFIWGSNDQQCKWHSVAWHNICRPKSQMGLGLRDIQKHTKALLMKLAWNIIYQPEALWVRVLKAKYKCGFGKIPRMKGNGAVSSIWHGMCCVWKNFLKGVQWNIGSGQRINFWVDQWIPGGIILKDFALHNLDETHLG